MPNMPSFGSGSQILSQGMQGGNSAVIASLQARGVDPSVLQGMSPSSAGFNPAVSLPPQPMGNIAPPPQGGGQPMPPPQPPPQEQNLPPNAPPMGVPQPESELIVKALATRLQSLSKAGM